jgi:quinoprotein glucose dehydrogenase
MKYLIKFILFSFFIPIHTFANKDFSDFKKYKTTNSIFKLEKISNGLNYPWGITFIDENNLVVTEKNGVLKKINITNGKTAKIKHKIQSIEYKKFRNTQGGLLDVLYHKGFLYFSYSRGFSDQGIEGSSTVIARGKLIKDKIVKFKILFVSKPFLKKNIHWGSRLIIKDNHLYASIGERGLGMIAQDPAKHPGSIIRINLDGTIPKDNPVFLDKPNWLPEIFLIGVRNPQGMAISPNDEGIYFSQHGPRGGDNIGKIIKGGNYGWKDIAWGGTEYYGAKIGSSAFKKKYNEPIISWVPSIGVGQINFYKGQTFSEWNDDMLVSSTKEGLLIKLKIEENKIIDEEIIIDQSIGRIRDFEIDIKGDIYLVTDSSDSHLWRLHR